jgi:hypothetical protein
MKLLLIAKRLGAMALAAALLVATPATASASDSYSGDDWEYSLDLYMWMSGMKGSTNSGVDFEVDFDTLLKNLKMTFMGALEARNGKYSLFADIIYLNVGGSKSATVVGDGPFGFYRDRKVGIGLKSWIVTLGGGYNLIDTQQHRLDIIAGARYFSLREDLSLKVSVGSVTLFDRSVSVSDHVWDAIVGVKGKVNIDGNWFIPYYFDIGTGGSDLTLQAMAGVGYSFDWGDVLLAYRFMHYDYKSDFINSDLDVSGPLLGAKFRF